MAKWLIGLNSLRSFWQRFVRFSGVRAFCSERSRWRVIILESAFASPGIFCKHALLLGWVTVLSTKAALFWLWIHMDSVPFWQFSVVERLPDTHPKECFFLRAIRIQWSKEVFFGMMLLIFSLINSQEKENPQLMFWKKFAQRCLINFIDELVVVKAWRISTSIFIRESLQKSRNMLDVNTCLLTGCIKPSGVVDPNHQPTHQNNMPLWTPRNPTEIQLWFDTLVDWRTIYQMFVRLLCFKYNCTL